MKLLLAFISARRSKAKSVPAEAMIADFLARASRLCPCESVGFDSTAALFAASERQPGRPAAQVVLFDSRGEAQTSEQFAAMLGRLRDEGAARVLFAIGPADGWTAEDLARAHRTVSLGRMTLPHDLARVVAAEQIYRALTILAGHPYHCGH